ncbi:MAG: DUF3617 domain-containing protein [Piscinibacter sp.]|uniref:DUF3617 domain-containing protein n=1 Tax=Piscinibacter sp. TaxID=1903157 RepID=UPI003D0D384C
MIVRRPLFFTIALCACSSPALAQLSPKPELGLWETRTKITVNGRDMLADMRAAQEAMMKSLSPAERAQMAEAMKAQGAGAPAETDQMCIDAKSLADWSDSKARLREMEQDMPGCKFEQMSMSGSTLQFKGRCADPQGFTGDMLGTMTMKGPRAWTSVYTGKGQSEGRPMDMRVESSSRWLAASCGAVKPER